MNDDDLNKIRVVVKEVVRDEITLSEKRILGELGDFMENQLFPMLEEKADKSDIDRIERKLDILSDKVIVQEKALRDIASLPTVAHELKIKKAA